MEDYMPGEWFRMVKEEETEEEVLYSYRIIIVKIDFQECNIEIMQDKHLK